MTVTTIKQVLAEINALPNILAVFNWKTREFRVRFNNDSCTDYFTEDPEDALGSAHLMSKQNGEL